MFAMWMALAPAGIVNAPATLDAVALTTVLAPVGVLILGLTFIYWSKSSNRHYTSLVNAYRKDRPTFWQRSRDDWIVGVVMLLLGGVLGYLVNQIT